MISWFKKLLKRYDNWCRQMGLTPDQKRSCVPYRQDPQPEKKQDKQDEQR